MPRGRVKPCAGKGDPDNPTTGQGNPQRRTEKMRETEPKVDDQQLKRYWMRFYARFFDKHEIKILLAEDRDYVFFYIAMLLESVAHEGRVRYTDERPYTPKMLALLLNMPKAKVEKSIATLKEVGLLEVLDDGTMFLPAAPAMCGYKALDVSKERTTKWRTAKIGVKNGLEKPISGVEKPDLQGFEGQSEGNEGDFAAKKSAKLPHKSESGVCDGGCDGKTPSPEPSRDGCDGRCDGDLPSQHRHIRKCDGGCDGGLPSHDRHHTVTQPSRDGCDGAVTVEYRVQSTEYINKNKECVQSARTLARTREASPLDREPPTLALVLTVCKSSPVVNKVPEDFAREWYDTQVLCGWRDTKGTDISGSWRQKIAWAWRDECRKRRDEKKRDEEAAKKDAEEKERQDRWSHYLNTHEDEIDD